MAFNVHRNHEAYEGRGEGGGGGGGGYGGSGRGRLYTYRYTVTTRMTPNFLSDESHFNVSVGSDGQSHKTVSINHNLCEEKGELNWYRTEVLPLTSITPYR